jgi:hypothetical protein
MVLARSILQLVVPESATSQSNNQITCLRCDITCFSPSTVARFGLVMEAIIKTLHFLPSSTYTISAPVPRYAANLNHPNHITFGTHFFEARIPGTEARKCATVMSKPKLEH